MKILLKTVQALALRSRIVLAYSDGADNGTVAVTLAVTQQTVYEWRDRFLKKRLGGLRDAPRSG
jgi:transposase